MEAVAAHVQALVVLIRHAVEIRLGRHGLMESGIEHGHVGRARHDLLARLDAHEVGGVMQRTQRDIGADGVLDLLVDKHAGGERLAAVEHAMAHRADFVHMLDRALLRVGQGLDHEGAGLGVVLDGLLKDDLLAVDLLGELAALDADALHQALGHELFAVHVHQLVFQRGRTRVDDQNFHWSLSLSVAYACALTAVMDTTLTISSTEQPRLRSLTGLARPWMMGPMASAPARRCTSL